MRPGLEPSFGRPSDRSQNFPAETDLKTSTNKIKHRFEIYKHSPFII